MPIPLVHVQYPARVQPKHRSRLPEYLIGSARPHTSRTESTTHHQLASNCKRPKKLRSATQLHPDVDLTRSAGQAVLAFTWEVDMVANQKQSCDQPEKSSQSYWWQMLSPHTAYFTALIMTLTVFSRLSKFLQSTYPVIKVVVLW